jgi:hypothetical protein
MAQAMYKHEALLNLIWCVADADKSASDEWVGEVSNAEINYFNAIKAAEGIEIEYDAFMDKRFEIMLHMDLDAVFIEALKATNGCAREWRVKAYGYMWRMALKSWEGQYSTTGNERYVSVNEKALLDQAREYFGITPNEDEQCISLTKV